MVTRNTRVLLFHRRPSVTVLAPYLLLFLLLLLLSICVTTSAFVTTNPSAKSAVSSISSPRQFTTFRHSATATTASQPEETTTTTAAAASDEEKLPYIIELLPRRTNPAVYKEIAAMCISAFFNDGAAGSGKHISPPWKELQLSYLRSLQQGDLRRRRENQSDINFMLVARRVIPASTSRVRHSPLILDFDNVFNLDSAAVAQQNQDFVRGEIIGFVEVTQRPYCLSGTTTSTTNDADGNENVGLEQRPFLTNLSVRYGARRSGIGSKLAERCECEVMRRWNKKEIILEVEEDNLQAFRFYEKRGYKLIFIDPTSRRYDAKGLWLQERRCKRFVMRKILQPVADSPAAGVNGDMKSTLDKGVQVLLRLRDTVFANARF